MGEQQKINRVGCAIWVFIITIALFVYLVKNAEPNPPIGKVIESVTKNYKAPDCDCVCRGIKYYKDIGSFPKLSTGEDAVFKVKVRCNRTKSAF